MVQWRKIVAPRPEHLNNGKRPEERLPVDEKFIATAGEKFLMGVLVPVLYSAGGWIVMVGKLLGQSKSNKDYSWLGNGGFFILFFGFPICILLTWIFARIVSDKRWKKSGLATLLLIALSFPTAIILLVYLFIMGAQ